MAEKIGSSPPPPPEGVPPVKKILRTGLNPKRGETGASETNQKRRQPRKLEPQTSDSDIDPVIYGPGGNLVKPAEPPSKIIDEKV